MTVTVIELVTMSVMVLVTVSVSEGLKRTHTLLAKSNVVIPALWSVSSTEGTSYRLPNCAITCEPLKYFLSCSNLYLFVERLEL